MKYYFRPYGQGLGSPPCSANEWKKISQVSRSYIILIKPVLGHFRKGIKPVCFRKDNLLTQTCFRIEYKALT